MIAVAVLALRLWGVNELILLLEGGLAALARRTGLGTASALRVGLLATLSVAATVARIRPAVP